VIRAAVALDVRSISHHEPNSCTTVWSAPV
jgi:hypothetical protein